MHKEEKICLAVNAFLKHTNLTISELSQLPELKSLSRSSIQRYLNDPQVAILFGDDVAQNIKDILKLKGMEGRKKGGLISFQNNTAMKDENGRFIGSKKAETGDNINRKIKHILIFTQLFLENPNASLQEIADMYNKAQPDGEKVTRAYVYDCLSEHTTYNIFSDEITALIASQLEQRRILGNKNGADITNGKGR